MKKAAFFSIIILSIASFGCKKNSSSTPAPFVYKGIVVFSTCTHTMIQTIGPDYLGEDTWVSGTYTGAPVYHHVFAVQNGCQFPAHNSGDTVNFKVINPQVQNCVACMVAVAVPDSVYAIQVVD